MNMDAVEQDVDAARCAAVRIDEAHKAAKAAKDESLKVIYEKDGWLRYKKSKKLWEEVEEAMRDAENAYREVSERRQAVIKATKGYEADSLVTLAREAVESAYKEANQKINILAQLVGEVRQNFRDAFDLSSDALG